MDSEEVIGLLIGARGATILEFENFRMNFDI